jgi:hypothetical protein
VRIRTPRAAFWRATLAGFGCVMALLLIGAIVARYPVPASDEEGAAVRLRGAQSHAASTSRADLVSLRATRRIAHRQLREAARALSGCPRPARGPAWRDCVRWPLAHVAISGRASAGVLYAVAQDLGGCREQAMGEANELRLMAGQADQLVRGLANTSPLARSERASAFAATRRLIGGLRAQLRRELAGCRLEPVAG